MKPNHEKSFLFRFGKFVGSTLYNLILADIGGHLVAKGGHRVESWSTQKRGGKVEEKCWDEETGFTQWVTWS